MTKGIEKNSAFNTKDKHSIGKITIFAIYKNAFWHKKGRQRMSACININV